MLVESLLGVEEDVRDNRAALLMGSCSISRALMWEEKKETGEKAKKKKRKTLHISHEIVKPSQSKQHLR